MHELKLRRFDRVFALAVSYSLLFPGTGFGAEKQTAPTLNSSTTTQIGIVANASGAPSSAGPFGGALTGAVPAGTVKGGYSVGNGDSFRVGDSGSFGSGDSGSFASGGSGSFGSGGSGSFGSGGSGSFGSGGSGSFGSGGNSSFASGGNSSFASGGNSSFAGGGNTSFAGGGNTSFAGGGNSGSVASGSNTSVASGSSMTAGGNAFGGAAHAPAGAIAGPARPAPTNQLVIPSTEQSLIGRDGVKVIDESSGKNPIIQVPNFEVEQSPQTIDRVNRLELQGEKLFSQQHFTDKALSVWQEGYGLSLEMKYKEGQGRALVNMCRVYLERRDFVKSKYLGENAIEVLSETSDEKAMGRARVVLAKAYLGLGNLVWAGQQLDEALKVLMRGTDTAAEAGQALSMAGSLSIRLRHYKEGIQYLESAANYYGQAGDNGSAISTRVALSNIMHELGFLQAALDESGKAASLARTCNSPHLMVVALSSVANAQYALCEFAAARQSYEQVLELAKRSAPGLLSKGGAANIELGYGSTLISCGDGDLGRQFIERAIPVLKAEGSMHGVAQAYNILGVLEESQGAHGKALQTLGQALDLQPTLVPKEHKLHTIILQNLAAVQARSGNNRDARMHLESALQMVKKHKDTFTEGRICSSLAEILVKLADPAQAETYVRQAIAISEKCNDDASLWRDYTVLGKIHIQKGEIQPAKEAFSSALSFFRSPQAGSFPSAERLTFPSARQDLGQQLVAMVAKLGMGEQALLAAEQLKDEAFSNEWHRRGGQVKPEDKDIYTELSTQRAHLHAAESCNPPDKLVKEWQAWMQRFRTLVSQNRPLARLISPVPNMVQDVMRHVQASRGTVVEYLVGADSSVVFTLDATARITATVLPTTRKQIQSQVTALLALPSSNAEEAQRGRILLQSLFNELLPESVRNFLPRNPDQVIAIIPDGILFNLPFAALMDSQGKYFIEQHTITLASSMGAFIDAPAKYATDTSVMVACARNVTGAAEASMISRLFQPTQITTLDRPELGALQEEARGKSIVHFGTNIPLNSDPMRSVLLPTPGKEGGNKVTANRLFGLSIPSDLVVLSSSSLNAADVHGDAVTVFSRGLGYAGARNLLMSLWVEPDPVRTDELAEFYKNRQAGMSQAQSLRKAQLVSLSRDPAPRSWAAFQLLGPGF